MKRFYSLLVLFLAFSIGLNAVSINPGYAVKGVDYSEVFFAFGTFALFGMVFSNNFKKFFSKSSIFKKSDSPEYDESNPPIMKAEGVEGSGDLDSQLDGLKNAIDSGEVTLEESSIRDWCSNNGVSDEDTDYIISVLLDGGESMQKSEDFPEDEDTAMEESNDEFEKSLIKYFNNMESRIIKTERTLSNFIKSNQKLEKSLKDKDEQIKFLKSEISKYSGQPVNPKNVTKESVGTPGHMTRPEIIGHIKKGMSKGLCGLDDMMAYETKGILPENFNRIVAEKI